MLFSSDILSLSDISDTIKREYLDILDNYKKDKKLICEICETIKKEYSDISDTYKKGKSIFW